MKLMKCQQNKHPPIVCTVFAHVACGMEILTLLLSPLCFKNTVETNDWCQNRVCAHHVSQDGEERTN